MLLSVLVFRLPLRGSIPSRGAKPAHHQFVDHELQLDLARKTATRGNREVALFVSVAPTHEAGTLVDSLVPGTRERGVIQDFVLDGQNQR